MAAEAVERETVSARVDAYLDGLRSLRTAGSLAAIRSIQRDLAKQDAALTKRDRQAIMRVVIRELLERVNEAGE